MRLIQSPLDQVKQNDNASFFIKETPRVDLPGEVIGWFVQYLAALERINLEKRRRSELYHPATYSELFVCEAPIHESTTTLTDFEAHLTHEEETLIDEPLPRLPLQAQPVKVKLKIGGRGKPAFKIETEISLWDDDQGYRR